MKLAILSEFADGDAHAFSGIPRFMTAALRRHHDVVRYVHVPPFDLTLALADPAAGRAQLEEIGRFASAALRDVDVDAVLCQGSAMIPFLVTSVPVVLWHDSNWRSLFQLDTDDFATSLPLFHEWDERVLARCDLFVAAADWLVQDISTASGHSDRLVVVPFGANVQEPARAVVDAAIEQRGTSTCRLVFVGIEWRRKGLRIAHALCRTLNRAGVTTTLDVVGTDLRDGVEGSLEGDAGELDRLHLLGDSTVRVHGFLSKSRRRDIRRLEQLLLSSHFLVHPANFECYGVVLAEANAFGLPVLTTNRYGPSSIVDDGCNGHRFPLDSFVEDAAAFVVATLADDGAYALLARRTRAAFDERLNWDASIAQLTAHIVGRRA